MRFFAIFKIVVLLSLICIADDQNQTINLEEKEKSPIKYGAGVAYVSLPHYIGSDQTHRIIFPYPKIETKHFILEDDGSILRLFQNETYKIDMTASGRLPVYPGEEGKEEEKGVEFIKPSEKNRLRAGLNELSVVMLVGVEFISDPNEYINIEIPFYKGRAIGESTDVGYVFSPKLEFKLLKDGYKNHKLNIHINHMYATQEYNRYYYGIEKRYINSIHTKEYLPVGGLVYQRYGFSYEYKFSLEKKLGLYFSKYDMSNSVVKESTLIANEISSSMILFYSMFF